VVPSLVSGGAGPFQFLFHAFHDIARVEQGKHREQAFLVEWCETIPVRNFQQQMEVVRHETVSDNPHPGERLLVAEDLPEDLLVPGFKDHAPVHDAGHDVVKGSAGSEEAGSAHGEAGWVNR
jgi:hypothetical protein